MKRIGMICLAMVLALGALGVAYAPWTDEVEITQTVQTGSLEVGVFGGYYVEGDDKEILNMTLTHGAHKFDKEIEDAPPWAGFDPGTHAFYQSATISIGNFYPCVVVREDFVIGVGGTVPVHLQVDIDIDDDEGVYDHVNIFWEIWLIREGVAAPISGMFTQPALEALDDIKEFLEDLQLYGCDALVIFLDKHLAQSGPQGETASFTIEVKGVQYNY